MNVNRPHLVEDKYGDNAFSNRAPNNNDDSTSSATETSCKECGGKLIESTLDIISLKKKNADLESRLARLETHFSDLRAPNLNDKIYLKSIEGDLFPFDNWQIPETGSILSDQSKGDILEVEISSEKLEKIHDRTSNRISVTTNDIATLGRELMYLGLKATTNLIRYPLGEYDGELIGILPSGEGHLAYGSAHGKFDYSGTWDAGQKSGYGKLVGPKYQFVGNWNNDLKDGYGKEDIAGWYRYTGNFKKGDRHGEGIAVYRAYSRVLASPASLAYPHSYCYLFRGTWQNNYPKKGELIVLRDNERYDDTDLANDLTGRTHMSGSWSFQAGSDNMNFDGVFQDGEDGSFFGKFPAMVTRAGLPYIYRYAIKGCLKYEGSMRFFRSRHNPWQVSYAGDFEFGRFNGEGTLTARSGDATHVAKGLWNIKSHGSKLISGQYSWSDGVSFNGEFREMEGCLTTGKGNFHPRSRFPRRSRIVECGDTVWSANVQSQPCGEWNELHDAATQTPKLDLLEIDKLLPQTSQLRRANP